MAKPKTRAQEFGYRPKSLRSKTVNRLERVKRQLEAIAYEWEEPCSAYSASIEDLYVQINELQTTQLDQSIEHLNSPVEEF